MALHEEHTNAYHKTPRRSYLEQERLQLSASVEETLATSSPQDEQWDDEAHYTSRKTALIPPRLSLQSKMLPAVRPEHGVQSTTGMQPVARPQKEAAPNQNVFKRFIQHLTSPFTAPNATAPQEEPMVQAGLNHPRSQDTAVLPEVHSLSQQARPYERRDSSPLPTIIDAVPSVRPPVMPIARQVDDTGKYRVAGRNAKVRLETTPMPSVRPTAPSADVPKQTSVIQTHNTDALDIREPVNVLLRTLPTDKNSNGDVSPMKKSSISGNRGETIEFPSSEHRQDTSRTADVKMDTESDERKSLSGTAMFENGQCDYMVKNTRITSSSVVQVMLTANPGPVAVHYVTLQPQVGFTIHLTGPTAVKTPFNYIII